MKKTTRIIVPRGGAARWIYDDETQQLMSRVGEAIIRRASHVDVYADLSRLARRWLDINSDCPPDSADWFADLQPVLGPVLGPFETHDEAIRAELAWLNANNIPVV